MYIIKYVLITYNVSIPALEITVRTALMIRGRVSTGQERT